jgi:hypothetical protein
MRLENNLSLVGIAVLIAARSKGGDEYFSLNSKAAAADLGRSARGEITESLAPRASAR